VKQGEHRIRTDDGVELALHRVAVAGAPRVAAAPLLLASGTFNSRSFWLGDDGQGVAWQLARSGFDTWIMEPRGHGASQRPSRWLLSDWIERDAPAAVAAVCGVTGADGVTWVGHSAGGVVGAAFAGIDEGRSRMLRGLVLLGTPGPGTVRGRRRWLARGLHWAAAARLGGLVPGERLKLGPEMESAPLVRQWLGWNLAGSWRGPGGEDYLACVHRVTARVLAVAGSGDDLLAPLPAVRDLLDRFRAAERTLLVAGRGEGMSRDYNHGGMVLARSAREEIWPLIERWLARPSTPDAPLPELAERP
jgi:pimeloyl-ACP methyl ester carboxylesterase